MNSAFGHLLRRIPKSLRRGLQQVWFFPGDCVDALKHRKQDGMPPRHLRRLIGDGDFHAIGRDFLQLFIDPGGLKPSHHVADIGCGTGRMAFPLMSFLEPHGRYEGLDVSFDAVRWCRKHIEARDPRFRFHTADVHNHTYHPRGRIRAEEYRFPWPDNSFDFVFLTSVFTHMLAPAMARYFSQITRILKPGGRSFMTFFLMNGESRRNMPEGRAGLHFDPPAGGIEYLHDADEPENAVAYDERHILALHEKHGLEIIAPVHYGTWCGRPEGPTYQDFIVAEKTAR